MELILGGILFAIAVAIGTSLPFWVGFLVLVFLFYTTLRVGGLEQIFPIIISIIVTLGLIVGNISYAIQTDYFDSLDIGNPFVVEKPLKEK